MLLPLRLRLRSSSTAELPDPYLHNPWYRKSRQVRTDGAQWVNFDTTGWTFHSDARIDVAVTTVSLDLNEFDHLFLPREVFFVTQDVVRDERIGPGDELFFPGLFSRRIGENANIPILRTGNIAAMPSEYIQTNWGFIRGYLAEARSIGGLSGSPVFVHLGAPRARHPQAPSLLTQKQRFWLIGLVHGHYGTKDLLDEAEEATIDDVLSRSINMGIAIIVPSEDIDRALETPELRAAKNKWLEILNRSKKESLPEAD